MKEVIKKCEEKMTKTCENLDGEFSNIRAGRANPNLLNRIMVEYYGTPTPMQQVGNISVPEPRIIQINPWEKSLLKAIEKAILASDLGITPTNLSHSGKFRITRSGRSAGPGTCGCAACGWPWPRSGGHAHG